MPFHTYAEIFIVVYRIFLPGYDDLVLYLAIFKTIWIYDDEFGQVECADQGKR